MISAQLILLYAILQVQQSVGYNQVSYYNLFKELSALRASESSLRWGYMNVSEASKLLL